MAELNTLAPKKWLGNYGGVAPVIDTTDGVYVGDLAIDTSNGNKIWECLSNTDSKAVWVPLPSRHGNYSVYQDGIIYSKGTFYASQDTDNDATYYTGNATVRDITTNNFFPHIFFGKGISTALPCMWTYMGMCKIDSTANAVGGCLGVNSNDTGVSLGTGATLNTNNQIYNWWAIGIHDGTLTKMYARTFKYTGNGSDNRAMTGLDFTPDTVIIFCATAQYPFFRNKYHAKAAGAAAGDLASYFANPSADIANTIQSMDADGFTIGTNAAVNTNALVYHGIAFASNASGDADVCLTDYQGMAGDGSHLDLPFQPNIAFAIPAGALSAVVWTDTMIAGQSKPLNSYTANITDGILGTDARGLKIGSGTEVNTANTRVVVLAIKTDLASVTLTG